MECYIWRQHTPASDPFAQSPLSAPKTSEVLRRNAARPFWSPSAPQAAPRTFHGGHEPTASTPDILWRGTKRWDQTLRHHRSSQPLVAKYSTPYAIYVALPQGRGGPCGSGPVAGRSGGGVPHPGDRQISPLLRRSQSSATQSIGTLALCLPSGLFVSPMEKPSSGPNLSSLRVDIALTINALKETKKKWDELANRGTEQCNQIVAVSGEMQYAFSPFLNSFVADFRKERFPRTTGALWPRFQSLGNLFVQSWRRKWRVYRRDWVSFWRS